MQHLRDGNNRARAHVSRLQVKSGYPLKHYRVFCYLTRMGYIVYR